MWIYLSPFSATWKRLGVTFDLCNNLYKPYRKPNNKPIYINKQPNHPPNVLKQLSKSIAKRISDTSSKKDIFLKISKDRYLNQFRFTITHCARAVLKRSYSIRLVTQAFRKKAIKEQEGEKKYRLILYIQEAWKRILVRILSTYY